MRVEPLNIRRKLALEIARYLEKQQIKEHPLRQLFWECTLRCNLNCRHCGSDCKKTAGIMDMPLHDFLRVLDSIARKTDPHRVMIVVTGGEPLIRKDLEECMSECPCPTCGGRRLKKEALAVPVGGLNIDEFCELVK